MNQKTECTLHIARYKNNLFMQIGKIEHLTVHSPFQNKNKLVIIIDSDASSVSSINTSS